MCKFYNVFIVKNNDIKIIKKRKKYIKVIFGKIVILTTGPKLVGLLNLNILGHESVCKLIVD